DSQRDAAQARDDARHGVRLVIDRDEDAESHASFDSPSYRLSLRSRVEGSMPRTSAARVLLPPSLGSTQVMYARSITSRVGFVCGRSATSGSARRSVSLSGSAARSIVVALLSTTARSRAFSS